jgi:hypothetical protein
MGDPVVSPGDGEAFVRDIAANRVRLEVSRSFRRGVKP